jgi:hypothetical protein
VTVSMVDTIPTQAAIQSGALDFLSLIPWQTIALAYVIGIFTALGGYVCNSALVALMAATYSGARMSVGGALRVAIGRLPTLVAIWLLVYLAVVAIVLVGGGIAAALFALNVTNGALQPGLPTFVALIVIVGAFVALVFLQLRWMFGVQVATLERLPAVASLARSWRLVAGSTWRALGYQVFFGILAGLYGLLVQAIVALPAGSGMDTSGTAISFVPSVYFANSLLGGILGVLLQPLWLIGLTLLYFDLRFKRREPPAPESAGSVAEQ